MLNDANKAHITVNILFLVSFAELSLNVVIVDVTRLKELPLIIVESHDDSMLRLPTVWSLLVLEIPMDIVSIHLI